jgi:hypothetical protein
MHLPVWRRVASFAGFVAVALQSASFVAFWGWPNISRDTMLLGSWGRLVFASFIVAVPCVLAGKGASRWWLLALSVVLFVVCFFLGNIA